jgi:hypothetical protein
MLSPSEIQRVEDWVGIETPIRPPATVSPDAAEVSVVVEPELAQPARTNADAVATAANPSSFLNNSVPFVLGRTPDGFDPNVSISFGFLFHKTLVFSAIVMRNFAKKMSVSYQFVTANISYLISLTPLFASDLQFL